MEGKQIQGYFIVVSEPLKMKSDTGLHNVCGPVGFLSFDRFPSMGVSWNQVQKYSTREYPL